MKTGVQKCLLVIVMATLILAASNPTGIQYKKFKKDIPKTYRSAAVKGYNYLKKGQAYQARKIFNDLVKRYPEFYVYWGLGNSERMMGNFSNARSLYFKALELNDSLYCFLRDYTLFSEEIPMEWLVIRRLATAMYDLQPDDFPLMYVIDRVMDSPDEKKAADFFVELKTKHPESFNIDVYHAILLNNIGENTAALDCALRVIDVVEDPFQLRMLERILSNNGRFVDAARVCEKLSDVAKKSAYTYDAWGHLEFKQGHYENAVIHYEKALNYDYCESYLMTLAQIYHFYLDNTVKAAYYCKAALQINRNLVDAYFILAENFRKAGKPDKALQYSLKQIELLPDHPHPLYYHGKLLFELNRFSEAVIYLEKTVAISPDVQRYRLILAKAYAGSGQKEKARETYANFLNEPINNLWTEEDLLKEEPPEPK